MPKIKLRKKGTKLNLKITAKRHHANLPTLTKIYAKFQKDPAKTVGGVAFTRFDTLCDGQSDRRTDARGKQYVSRPWRGHNNPTI